MEQHLITSKEIGTLARPVSRNIDDARLLVCIDEAEQIDIKPTLGDSLLLDILDNKEGEYDELLAGGRYDKGVFKGLKVVAAYYAYARLIRISDTNVTRYGVVSKDDEYSTRIGEHERNKQVAEARNVADRYFSECLSYMRYKGFISGCNDKRVQPQQRIKYNIIGE